MSANVQRWRALAERAQSELNSDVPVAFVLATIAAESTGTPGATRGEPAIGDASIGLMQVLGATARKLGFLDAIGDRKNLTGLYDPYTNIYYGSKLLKDLWAQLGNAAGVASAYNGGIRPKFGFGKPFPGPGTVTVCLARDAVGKCIKNRVVQPGEFGNAEYVRTVINAIPQYTLAQKGYYLYKGVDYKLPDVVITGTPPLASDPTKLLAIAAVVAGLLVLLRKLT